MNENHNRKHMSAMKLILYLSFISLLCLRSVNSDCATHCNRYSMFVVTFMIRLHSLRLHTYFYLFHQPNICLCWLKAHFIFQRESMRDCWESLKKKSRSRVGYDDWKDPVGLFQCPLFFPNSEHATHWIGNVIGTRRMSNPLLSFTMGWKTRSSFASVI